MDDFRRSALERLLGRDALQPALLGKLFVRGEIQTHEQADFSIRGGGWFFRRRGTRFWGSGPAPGPFRGFSFGFFPPCPIFGEPPPGIRFWSRAFGAVQLVFALFFVAAGLA